MELKTYICEKCGHHHNADSLGWSDEYDGQCRRCYADIETGKYIDTFFYVIADDTSIIAQTVQRFN